MVKLNVKPMAEHVEAAFDVLETEIDLSADIPPETFGEDLRRKKSCERCGADYVAVLPSMLIEGARTRGGSRSWDAFRGTDGHCESCLAQVEYEEKCAEAEREKARAREHRAQEWEKICPATYRKTVEDLLPKQTSKQRGIVMGWRMNPRGLLIPGPSGTGKTRTVWQLMRRLRVEEGLQVRIFDCVSFQHECNRHAMDSETFEHWAKQIVEVDVLFFDDLGKFRLSDRVESELFAVVERRCAWERPIIATTNDTDASLKARMSEDRGEPLIRRLKEFCQIVAFE